MANKKAVKIKIREVPSKIKLVKILKTSEKESSEQDNSTISVTKNHDDAVSPSRSSGISLILNQSPTSERETAQPVARSSQIIAEETEREQEIRRLYSGSNYQSPKQKARSYEMAPTSAAFVLRRQEVLSSDRSVSEQNQELRELKSAEQENLEERYKLERNEKQEKPRRRYPWEA